MLPPWEAQKYFDQPAVRFVSLNNSPLEVCKENYMRVALYFLYYGASTVDLMPFAPFQTFHGIQLSSSLRKFAFYHYRDGPLVNLSWSFVGPVAGDSMVVIEVALQDWPQANGK